MMMNDDDGVVFDKSSQSPVRVQSESRVSSLKSESSQSSLKSFASIKTPLAGPGRRALAGLWGSAPMMPEMAAIEFVYGDMWHHYYDHVGIPTDDVYARVLSYNYSGQKFNHKSGKAEPFLNRGMDAFRLSDDDPLIVGHASAFPHGGFVVVEKSSSAEEKKRITRKKNLFIIAPYVHNNDTGLCSADHFSFMLNTGKKGLQFHYTKYFPLFEDSPNIGRVTHIHNHLPDCFEIVGRNQMRSSIVGKIVSNPELNRYTDVIQDMLTRQINYPNETRDMKGGVFNKKKKKTRKSNKRLDSLETFDVFTILPIHKIVVIGVRKTSDMFDVTIVVYDRLRHSPTHMFFAFLIEMKEDDMRDDERVELEIARFLHGKTRQYFEDPKI